MSYCDSNIKGFELVVVFSFLVGLYFILLYALPVYECVDGLLFIR